MEIFMSLEPVESFAVGQLYTNDSIRFALGVENLGGIRPSVDAQRRLRHVAIMTSDIECDRNITENPYADRIENDVLIYTAAGREGDQALTGRNKRLVEQYETPAPFFGFANVGRQRYRFLGLLQLIRHYPDVQADGKGNLRTVWMFEFRIHTSPAVIRISEARAVVQELFRAPIDGDSDTSTREEVCPSPVMGLDNALVERVRSTMLSIPPREFELLMARLFEMSGFNRVLTTPFQGDGGIDLDAYVGCENVFFSGTHVQAQVKRWRHTVGNVEINGFRGALSSTAKGVFISTGYFSRAAVREATIPAKPSISLIDGRTLAALCTQKGLVR